MVVSKLTHSPLHRLLSKLGLASRTQAAELVAAGRVRVDGQVVLDPQQWSPWDGLVEIDRAVVQASRARLLCLHKRRGVVTARVDPREKVVCDHPLLRDTGCGPVGRLDKASEGLLLFTNDTRLADRLTSPESHLPKVYEVRVGRPLRPAELEALGSDVDLGGELTQRSVWTSMAEERNPSWVRVQLREGKNRQIRRMLLALGVGVQRLIRTAAESNVPSRQQRGRPPAGRGALALARGSALGFCAEPHPPGPQSEAPGASEAPPKVADLVDLRS